MLSRLSRSSRHVFKLPNCSRWVVAISSSKSVRFFSSPPSDEDDDMDWLKELDDMSPDEFFDGSGSGSAGGQGGSNRRDDFFQDNRAPSSSSRGGGGRGGRGRGGSFNGRQQPRYNGGDDGFGGGSGGYGGGHSGHRGSGQRGVDRHNSGWGFDGGAHNAEPFSQLGNIDWGSTKLVPFRKDFYKEDESISSMSREEVKEIMKKHDVTLDGEGLPHPIERFEQMNFPDYINNALSKQNFSSPTDVQCFGWPIAMSGRDMIGVAQTGSGKTLGFLLPAIVHINAQEVMRPGDGPIALVMSPTRELAMQTLKECQRFGSTTQLKSCAVYGGASRMPQINALQSGCEIVVATPGRLLDFLDSGITNLQRVTYLVLDEADRMLDMGFEPQIRKIVSQIRPDRQTTFWTATWPKEIQRLAKNMSPDPIRLTVGSTEITANRDVKQTVQVISRHQKDRTFLQLMEKESREPGRILIFVATKRTADRMTQGLRRGGVNTLALHGDKSQSERDWVMSQFRTGDAQIVVATDIASRGLDIKDIKLVVNYDMPTQIEDYVHRIGRTARAGKSGRSHSFFTEEDSKIGSELIRVLQEAGQEVPADLKGMSSHGGFSSRGSNNRGGGGGRGGGGRNRNQRYGSGTSGSGANSSPLGSSKSAFAL